MPKLFVAIDLPSTATTALVAIQPQPVPGIRLVRPGQMHLTLHFIGEVDADRAERIATALDAIKTSSFPLSIEGVGQFASADGAKTLWAGIRENTELRSLHEVVGQALNHEGVSLEQRRYTPHISLARCAAEASAETINAFLVRHQDLTLAPVPITHFSLYSSVFQGGVPLYRQERAYIIKR